MAASFGVDVGFDNLSIGVSPSMASREQAESNLFCEIIFYNLVANSIEVSKSVLFSLLFFHFINRRVWLNYSLYVENWKDLILISLSD